MHINIFGATGLESLLTTICSGMIFQACSLDLSESPIGSILCLEIAKKIRHLVSLTYLDSKQNRNITLGA